MALMCAAATVFGPGLAESFSSRRSSKRSFAAGPLPLLGVVLPVIPAVIFGYWVSGFYEKHWSGISPGSVRYGAVSELAGYHGLLFVVCLVGALAVIWHLFHARGVGRLVAGASGILAAVLASGAFVMTVPRGGDEGVILWVIIAPAVMLSALLLLVLSVVLVVRRPRPQPEATFCPPFCEKCSYDLTGNASGRCPECGTPVPADMVVACAESLHEPRSDTELRSSWTTPVGRLAFAIGGGTVVLTAAHALSGFGFAITVLPGLFPFVLWRVEPSFLGLAMGVAMITAGLALMRRRRWAVMLCVMWSVGSIIITVLNLHHGLTLWGRMPPLRAGSERYIEWVALHVIWGLAIPAFFLVWFGRSKIREEIAAWRSLR